MWCCDLKTMSLLVQHIYKSDITRGRGGGDLVSIMPICVCQKVKDMGPFFASSEYNEWEDVIPNGCEICSFSL